jgi:transposase
MHPSNVLERRGAALAADLRLLAGPDLLALDLPPREPVIGPLTRGSVTLLRGKPGLGKSWLALSLATAAAAGGSACGWAAPRPARVLHVDAQMPLALLQARLAAIAGFEGMAPRDPVLRQAQDEGRRERPRGEGRRRKVQRQDEVIVEGPTTRRYFVLNPPEWPPAPEATPADPNPAPVQAPESLRLLAAEAQALPMPDLGAESGRAAFMRLLFAPPARVDGAAAHPTFDLPTYDLVVLDGLSALLRSARGRNYPAREFAEFLSALRRAGLAVLLVDRIRPRRRIAPPYEDMLDAILTVKRPPGLGEDGGGVHMALQLTGRALAEDEAFELRLDLAPAQGRPGWRRVARLDAAVLAAWRLERQGLSYRAIGRELGVSPATAWRLVQRADALPPEVLDEAAREMERDLLPPVPEVETAATVEMGETPEPAKGSPDWIEWTLRRLEAAILAERNGLTKAEAARRWAAIVKASKAPPGIFLTGPQWKAMDQAILDRLTTALDAPERPLPEEMARKPASPFARR